LGRGLTGTPLHPGPYPLRYGAAFGNVGRTARAADPRSVIGKFIT